MTHHQTGCVLTAKQRTRDVDVHGALEIFEREIDKGENFGYGCALNQNVASAMLVRNRLKSSGDCAGISYVNRNCCDRQLLRLQLCDQGGAGRFIAIGNDHMMTDTR
jgi:hypothetical protein